jgi:hypothetical protein
VLDGVAEGEYAVSIFHDCKFTVADDTAIYITLTAYKMP